MTDFLLLAFIFLIAGVLAVPIASRLGLGSVLGYLLAGVAISPLLALLNVDIASIQHFAEFGVVMMLFLVGLELKPQKLWEMRHTLLGLGGLQVVATAVLVMAVVMAMGQPWTIALAIGLVLSLSSTAIVLQTLGEKGLMKCDGGQASFSVLLFQDIAVIPMLAFIPLLALSEITHDSSAQSSGDHIVTLSLVEGLSGWQTALVIIAVVAFVLFVGNYLTRPLFRFISMARVRELFTATALLIVIGIALLMSLVGVSAALGTFLAGVVLANSEYRHELEADIRPFKSLLLGVFFITVGAGINFHLLFENFLFIAEITLGLMLLKLVVLIGLGYVFKVTGRDRWLMALGLAQAGEFGFVLLNFTVSNHVLPGDIAEQLSLVVAISMVLTPLAFILYDHLVVPKYNNQPVKADEITEQSDIIIIGHGRVGGIINRMVRTAGFATTVIDFSLTQLEMQRRFGMSVFFGDGTRPDLLQSAGIENAKILVIAIDDREQITNLVEYVTKHYPQVHIVARAIDRTHVYDLWSIGCRDIVRETYDSSLRMGRSVYEALGKTRPQARAMTEEFNQRDRKSMNETAKYYKRGVPLYENQDFIDRLKTLRKEWEEDLLGQQQTPETTELLNEDDNIFLPDG